MVGLFEKVLEVWPCSRQCVTKDMSFEASPAQGILSCPLSSLCIRWDVRFQLPIQHVSALHAAVSSTTKLTDSASAILTKSAKNIFLYNLSWSWCFLPAVKMQPRQPALFMSCGILGCLAVSQACSVKTETSPVFLSK